MYLLLLFFFSSRRRHTRCLSDWSSDVCSSDLEARTGETQRLAGQALETRAQRQMLTLDLLHRQLSYRMLLRRSEERRVGKECRSRGGAEREKKEVFESNCGNRARIDDPLYRLT